MPKRTAAPRRGTWGDRVRQLREQEGLSMAQLAARVYPPTTDSHISKLEHGVVQMTEEWVRRLADALRVAPLDITAPAAALSERERDLLQTLRSMAEDSRDTVFRVADGLARSGEPSNRKTGS